MPQYEPLPSLAGQPFTLVLPRIPATDLGSPRTEEDCQSLLNFIQHFPIQPGIGEVITSLDKERFASIPGISVHEVPVTSGAGDWLSSAFEVASCPRILVLGGGQGNDFPAEKDLAVLADKLESAHLVLLPRPQKKWNPVAAKFRQVWMVLRKWIFALDPKPNPKWPGLGSWWRRLLTGWVLAVPGEDPETPTRMVRAGLTQGMKLQSQGQFVWVEMLAKATFLSALIEELPVPDWPMVKGEKSGEPLPGRGWWRDFRLVFSQPDFGKPWSPMQLEPKSQFQNP